ncbi:MAG: hypothetical protein HQL63_00065 [Magnetococcales bacterium]|nr:hypothetical protein [Magnetococcales bacterium]MBF0323255.1 hypothetical protein [Magnetococcales bacterium]
MRTGTSNRSVVLSVVAWLLFFCVPVLDQGCVADGAEATQLFLARHWRRPVPPQGSPPAHDAAAETNLNPVGCALCHASQHTDWQASLHRHAISPGLLGQLLDMSATALEDHQACLRCHAPLAEQAETVATAIANKDETLGRENDGLTCAGCHVRQHRYYGPPARTPSTTPPTLQPHGGWTAEPAYEDARFCATCHQFAADDPALNGKLLENTFQEWRQSRHAREGKPCQTCHMPDRRHLWRGIHDPEMVRSGLAIHADPQPASPGETALHILIRNTGVGHYFPTYVTPRVVVEAWQQDLANTTLAGTRQEMIIGRDVTLDLTEERFDTRIPPDGQKMFVYHQPRHPQATALAWQIRVEPDHFYKLFYEAVLQTASNPQGKHLLQEALHQAQNSPYTLSSGSLPLALP